MRQSETLPSRILTKKLSGPEGDPIRIHLTRLEVRLQLFSYQQETSEMRAHLPLEHHEDHHDWHRSIRTVTEEAIRGITKRTRRACTMERLNLAQLPNRGKVKG
jgi:hypothetical protein